VEIFAAPPAAASPSRQQFPRGAKRPALNEFAEPIFQMNARIGLRRKFIIVCSKNIEKSVGSSSLKNRGRFRHGA